MAASAQAAYDNWWTRGFYYTSAVFRAAGYDEAADLAHASGTYFAERRLSMVESLASNVRSGYEMWQNSRPAAVANAFRENLGMEVDPNAANFNRIARPAAAAGNYIARAQVGLENPLADGWNLVRQTFTNANERYRQAYARDGVEGVAIALGRDHGAIDAELVTFVVPGGAELRAISLPTRLVRLERVGAEVLEGVGARTASEGVEAAINPRLVERLGMWRDYQARGGQLDMQAWIRSTQGQSWGLGGRSGYADWIRSVESTHGNSLLSSRTAYLYEKFDADGNFLKWGISQDIDVRTLEYVGKGERGIQLFEYARGTRREMASMERLLEETRPGRQNRQPWAVRAWNSGLGRER